MLIKLIFFCEPKKLMIATYFIVVNVIRYFKKIIFQFLDLFDKYVRKKLNKKVKNGLVFAISKEGSRILKFLMKVYVFYVMNF